MELQLRIIWDPHTDLKKQRVRVFSAAGGGVGRALDNHWVLPDPPRHLSGHHCQIYFEDDAFWVCDNSQNGVFVNGADSPLGRGNTAKLHDGDALRLATYVVRARLAKARNADDHSGLAHSHEQPDTTGEHAVDAGVAAAGEPAVVSTADRVTGVAEIGGVGVTGRAETPAEHEVREARNDATSEHKVLDEREETAAGHESGTAVANDVHAAYEQYAAGDIYNSRAEARAPDVLAEEVVLQAATQTSTLQATSTKTPAVAAHADETEVDLAKVGKSLTTRTLKTPTLKARQAKAPRIIHIDRDLLQAKGVLPPTKLAQLISNQYRHIKRPLINNALGKGVAPLPNGRLIMVTSSLPGEGKTFSSINLAFNIAREKDLGVVLIDADVGKQDVSRIFDVENEPGLLDLLLDESLDVDSLVLKSDVPGLSILPAGRWTDGEILTELLASSRMQDIAAWLGEASRKRIALFDSPPLLLTNEARVLASVMGQVLVVIRAGVTPQAAVREAIDYLEEDKAIGIVLNGSVATSTGSYYGYGAFGYGAYGKQGAGI